MKRERKERGGWKTRERKGAGLNQDIGSTVNSDTLLKLPLLNSVQGEEDSTPAGVVTYVPAGEWSV